MCSCTVTKIWTLSRWWGYMGRTILVWVFLRRSMCAERMGCAWRWVRWVLRGSGTASGHPSIGTVIAQGRDTTGWNKFGREFFFGTSRKRDYHSASSRNLSVFTDGTFTISSGSLFQYGTTRTLSTCCRRRVFHRCWWILKVWPQSPMRVGAAKPVTHGKSSRPCIILYMQIRLPRILQRTREKSRSRCRGVSYGTWSLYKFQRKFLNIF